MQNKLQEFNVDGIQFSMPSQYCPIDKIWMADVSYYEFNSESEMRMHMLMEFLAESPEELEMFISWDCRRENIFLARFSAYQSDINN
jgi:hypothetical protein